MSLFSWRKKDTPDVEAIVSEAARDLELAFHQKMSAADVEMTPPPKGKKSGAIPGFIRSAQTSNDAFLPREDPLLANIDLSLLRNSATSTSDLVRKLIKASPDLSAAVYSAIRMAVSGKYKVLARNLDGTINPEGTKIVQQLARRFDLLGGPLKSNDYVSFRSASESMAQEIFIEGAMAVEVILGPNRLPEGIRPISTKNIEFKYKGKRKVPFQKVGQEEVSLDVPTFFYSSLDQDLQRAYSDSPLQSALQPAQASQDFQNDLRRVFRRAIHPRLRAKIKTEEWMKSIPPEVKHDVDKLTAHIAAEVAAIKATLDGLNPEDAIIAFDIVEFDYMTGGNNSLSDEYTVLGDSINSKSAAGAKTMPTVLGHGVGSQNIASTESMLFVKAVEGAVQFKLNEIFSRALTVAVRLYGVDAVVDFQYAQVDLRPELELEAFRAMRQSRVLELLSLGLIPDEEASIELTGTLPPVGMKPLSGTMFTFNKPDPAQNGAENSNTSALNQDLNPDTPKKKKS